MSSERTTMMVDLEAEVARLKATGWTKADFAKALRDLLEPDDDALRLSSAENPAP